MLQQKNYLKNTKKTQRNVVWVVSLCVFTAYFLIAKSNISFLRHLNKKACNGNGVLYKGKCNCEIDYTGKTCLRKRNSYLSAAPKKENILFVVDYFEDDFVFAGRVLLAQKMAAEGSKMTVLIAEPTASFSKMKNKMKKWKIRLLRLKDPSHLSNRDRAVRNSYSVYETIKEDNEYGQIFFFGHTGLGHYTLLARKQGLAFSEITMAVVYDTQTRAKKNELFGLKVFDKDMQKENYMTQKSVESADFAVSPLKVLSDRLFQYNWDVRDSKVKTIPYPSLKVLNLHKEVVKRDKNAFPKRTKNITELVYIGNLCNEDGLDVFLTAIDRLIKKDTKQKGRVLKKRVLRIHFFGRNMPVSSESEITGGEVIEQRALIWGKRTKVTKSGNVAIKKVVSYLVEKGKARVAVLPQLVDTSGFLFQQLLNAGVCVVASSLRMYKEQTNTTDRKEALFMPGDYVGLSNKIAEILIVGGVSPRPLSPVSSLSEWNELKKVCEKTKYKKEKPLVSIVVVHHNRHLLLAQALRSIEQQKYKNIEVVIVDDGSTEQASINYISEIAWKFWLEKKWRVLREPNRYPGSARNKGALHAKGKYVLFMDDDNISKPHQIEKMVEVAETTGADIVTAGHEIFVGSEYPRGYSSIGRKIYLGDSILIGVSENCFGDSSMLVHKDFFMQTGKFTEDYGVGFEDYEFLAKIVIRGGHLETIPEALCWNRKHRKTLTQTSDKRANHIRFLRAYNDSFSYLHGSVQEMIKKVQKFNFDQVLITNFGQQIKRIYRNNTESNFSFKQERSIEQEPKEEKPAETKKIETKTKRKKGKIKRIVSVYSFVPVVEKLTAKTETAKAETKQQTTSSMQPGVCPISASYTEWSGEIVVQLEKNVSCVVGESHGCSELIELYEEEDNLVEIKECRFRFVSYVELRIRLNGDSPNPKNPISKLGFKDGNKYKIQTPQLLEIKQQINGPTPSAVVNATQNIGRNGQVLIDLSRSTTNAGHYFIDAQFTVKTSNKEKNSLLVEKLKEAALEFLFKKKMVFTFSSAILQEFVSYQLAFELTNIHQKTDTATIAIQKLNKEVPTVFIDGPRFVLQNKAAIFTAQLDGTNKEYEVAYSWVLFNTGKKEEVRFRDKKTNTIIFERNTLPVGDYSLVLKTQSTSFTAQGHTHRFTVMAGPFVARILGGSRTVYKEQPIQLSCSIQTNQAQNEQEQFETEWKFSSDKTGFEHAGALGVFGKEKKTTQKTRSITLNIEDIPEGEYLLYLKTKRLSCGSTHETKADIFVASDKTSQLLLQAEVLPYNTESMPETILLSASIDIEHTRHIPLTNYRWFWFGTTGKDTAQFAPIDVSKIESGGPSSYLTVETRKLIPGSKHCFEVVVWNGTCYGVSHVVVETPNGITEGYCRIAEGKNKGKAFETKFDISCVGWTDRFKHESVQYRFWKICNGNRFPIAPGSSHTATSFVLDKGEYEIEVEIYNDEMKSSIIRKICPLKVSQGVLSLSSYFSQQLEQFKATNNIRLGYELLGLVGTASNIRTRKSMPENILRKSHPNSEQITSETINKALSLIERISSQSHIDATNTGPYLLAYLHRILPERLPVDQRGVVLRSLQKISTGMDSDSNSFGRCYNKEAAKNILKAFDPIFLNPRDGYFLSFLVNEIKDEMQLCFLREIPSCGGKTSFETENLQIEFGLSSNTSVDGFGPFTLQGNKEKFLSIPYRVSATSANLMRGSMSGELNFIDHSVLEFKSSSKKATIPARFNCIRSKRIFEEKNVSSLPDGSKISFSYALSSDAQLKVRAGYIPVCVLYVRGQKVKSSGWSATGCETLGYSPTHVFCRARHYGEFSVFLSVQKQKLLSNIILATLIAIVLGAVFLFILFVRKKNKKTAQKLFAEPKDEIDKKSLKKSVASPDSSDLETEKAQQNEPGQNLQLMSEMESEGELSDFKETETRDERIKSLLEKIKRKNNEI